MLKFLGWLFTVGFIAFLGVAGGVGYVIWDMNTSRINPLGPDRTELIYNFYFADTSEDKAQERDDLVARNLAIVREDFEICLETHKNYASGAYTPGPLSPRHEAGVAYFQDRIRNSLGPMTP